MRTRFGVLAAGTVLLGFLVSCGPARMIADATLYSGNITVFGSKGAKLAAIMWEGTMVTQTNRRGAFNFTTAIVPQGCVGTLSDGMTTMDVTITGCTVAHPPRAMRFPATGETTCRDNDRGVSDCITQ